MSMHHHSNNGMHHGMGGMGNMAGQQQQQQNHQYMNGFGNGNSGGGMMGNGAGVGIGSSISNNNINNNNNSMNGMNNMSGMRLMPGNNMGHNSVGMQMNPMGHMNAGGAMGSYNSSRHHHVSIISNVICLYIQHYTRHTFDLMKIQFILFTLHCMMDINDQPPPTLMLIKKLQ